MNPVPVGALLDSERIELNLELTAVAGQAGLEHSLESDRISKAGLHLTGFFEYFRPERIHIFGRAEVAYLHSLGQSRAEEKLRTFLEHRPVAIVFTNAAQVPTIASELGNELGVPVFQTPLDTTRFTTLLSAKLEEILAPRATLHGVLMDVFGVGILMTGESGIGKSEVALDLILRGHRFVADDVVEVIRRPPATLIGNGSELIRHHIEIRGLGILNVKDLFGVAAVRARKKIEMLIELVSWEKSDAIERVGLDDVKHEILDVPVPHLKIPVSPGRNITSIVEVAARNQLLRLQGIHSARKFQERLLEDLSRRAGEELSEDQEFE